MSGPAASTCTQEEKHFVMAKKKTQARRVPRAAESRMYGDGKPSAPAQTAGQTAQPTAAAPRGVAQPVRTAGSSVRATNQQGDYHYVIDDLRRLGILAVSVFAVLIALGLIIR